MKVKVVERTGIFFILVQHLLLINVLGEGPFVDISEKNFFGTKTVTNADQNVAAKNEIFIGEEFFACNLNNSCDFVKTIAGGTDSSAVSWVKVREQMQSKFDQRIDLLMKIITRIKKKVQDSPSS